MKDGATPATNTADPTPNPSMSKMTPPDLCSQDDSTHKRSFRKPSFGKFCMVCSTYAHTSSACIKLPLICLHTRYPT